MRTFSASRSVLLADCRMATCRNQTFNFSPCHFYILRERHNLSKQSLRITTEHFTKKVRAFTRKCATALLGFSQPHPVVYCVMFAQTQTRSVICQKRSDMQHARTHGKEWQNIKEIWNKSNSSDLWIKADNSLDVISALVWIGTNFR